MGLSGETNHAFKSSRSPVSSANGENLPGKPADNQNGALKSGKRKLCVIILCALAVALIIIIAVTTWYATKSGQAFSKKFFTQFLQRLGLTRKLSVIYLMFCCIQSRLLGSNIWLTSNLVIPPHPHTNHFAPSNEPKLPT